ncbi:MAG TPA: hypothetical protein VMT88_10025, partial [Actinomycetes bacterium]|nr:hypothetical protein [Actinomycetes bacterium]
MPRVTRRRAVSAVLSVALATATLAMVHGGSATAATCALTPQLRDVAITQGVGSYTPLVRGKEALVRAYLSLPSCAAKSNTIAVTGASLSVSAAGTNTNITPDNLVTNPAPLLAPYTNAPAVDSPADTRFVVPGSVLAPAATAARFTATMTVRINYSAITGSGATPVTGSVNFTTRPGTTNPISTVVEKRSNALRILVVPMGDPTVSYAQQFTSTDQSTTSGAMRALARTLPVPDGASDLATSTTGGIRYAVAPTIADVRSFRTTINGVTKFCGTAANFDPVAANLSTFLQTWNTNNSSVPADRVIGVVSNSLSFGGDAGCAEGMSKVGQPITWARLVPDGSGSPSPTGSTMAMEIAHTFGDVSLTAANADPFSRYHSKNTQADDTAPNRAYNVPTRQFLATDRTVMAVRDTWNDQTTLFEPSDWAFTLCALTPSPPTSCPTSTSTVGTAQGIGNEPTFVISGVITQGSPPTADITESYFQNGVRFNVDNTSAFRLVQQTVGGPGGPETLSDVGVPINFETSDHNELTGPVTTENTATFTAAVPFNTGANRIKLMHGTDVLYSRDRVLAPEVLKPRPLGATERVSARNGPASDPDSQANDTTFSSDISGDGNLVVFRTRAQLSSTDNNSYDDIYLRDVAAETTTLITKHDDGEGGEYAANGPSFDPVISADGSTVAFVSSAENLSYDSPSDELDHVYVYDVDSGSTEIGDINNDYEAGNGSAQGRPALSS